MKVGTASAAILALLPTLLVMVGPAAPANASKPAAAQKASQAKPAVAGALPRNAQGVPTVALPYSFTCSHCGLKITITKQSQWTQMCPVCACGVAAYKCLPKGK